MFQFVINTKPRSYNARKKASYIENVQNTFREKFPNTSYACGNLYVRVYFLSRERIAHDADNISKPVLDALRGFAYEDDRSVILRIASAQRIQDPETLDFTNVPDEVIDDFIESLDSNGFAFYIEIGNLRNHSLRFGYPYAD